MATRVQDVPRLSLTPEEAAEALGMSRASFDRHVKPHVKLVRAGSMVLVPVKELDRWVDSTAEPTL